MRYKNLVFLGTSHIAKQSLDEVRSYIEKEKPGIIALELDRKRLPALMKGQKQRIRFDDIWRVGLKGFIFSLFGAWAEKKLGKIVGVSPGSEMKQAVRIARKEKIEIALVDQDIEITLQRLSKSITWKEKRTFVRELAKAFFTKEKEIDFDLTTVPEKQIVNKMVAKLKESYPNVYRVLIEERNKVIARNIKNLMDLRPNAKILVILGAGHIDDVLEMIKKEEQEISYSFSVG